MVRLGLTPVLQPVIDQLVLVGEILTPWVVGCLFDRPRIRRDDRRLVACANAAAALLVGEGKGTAERDRAKQCASDHEGAAALDRKAELGAGARWRNHLTLIEEIGIHALALIEVLSGPARGFHRAERDLRRLI